MYALLIIIILLLVGFVLLNVMAYRHAYAMLHFTDSVTRTQKPESLSVAHKARVLFTGINIPRPSNDVSPSDMGLECETHRYQSTDGIELEAWYIPTKDSKGLVLLFHGYSAAKSSLLTTAKTLHHSGYSTFLVDFRGSGGSDGNYTTIGYREADDVVSSFNFARTLLPDKPLILYGQSMGGAAILRAISAKGVSPDALIIEAVFDRMLSTVKARFSAMGIPSFPSAHLLTYWGSRQMDFSGLKHNPVNYARSVNFPTLILHGKEDPRATVEQAQNIFNHLDCSKKLVLFDNVGHNSCHDADPDKWKQAVEDFCGF